MSCFTRHSGSSIDLWPYVDVFGLPMTSTIAVKAEAKEEAKLTQDSTWPSMELAA